MMRKIIFISLIAALSLTACVKDSYKPEYCTDNSVYLAFVLRGAGQTLSQEEETKAPVTKASTTEGSVTTQKVAEQLVTRVDLYFYTGAGKYLGKHTQKNFTQTWQSSGNVSNEVGKFSVKLDYQPYRMLVTVNSEGANTDLTNLSLDEARKELQKSVDYASDDAVPVTYNDGSTNQTLSVKPFFMSSSTYLDKNSKVVCDVLIYPSQVKDNEADALNTPIPVYLERLAAKVTLKTPKLDFMVPVVTSQDTLTAKVTLVGWNVNTINRGTYYFKNVESSWTYKWQNNTIFWNNTDRYRSYWAKDNNYLSGENSGIELTQQPTSPLTGEKFRYRKPGELDFKDTRVLQKESGYYVGYTYCLENTADAGTLPVEDSPSSTLYSRATHILIRAQLSFEAGAGATEDDDDFGSAKDFFRYKGMFFTEKGLIKALRRDTDIDPTIPDANLKFDTAQDQSYCAGYDKGERVAVKNGSTFLDLKDAVTGERIRIDGFKDGEFYYKIPIEHINDDDVSSTDTYYPVAKYGVVRNHEYTITISEDLKGIGTGIWDKTLDIRPFRKTDDYRVTAYVRVSPWMQFETRFLFIDPSGLLVTDGQKVIWWADDGDPSKKGDGSDEPDNDVSTGNGWYF